MRECPYIDKTAEPDDDNRRVEVQSYWQTYAFWEHRDPDGAVARVQMCKLIGRKRDVFECFNEDEWRVCPHYTLKEPRR